MVTIVAIPGNGKVGGTCFAPKPEDTEHDDVPSPHRAAAGLEGWRAAYLLPARDIIASNFPHNINTQLLDTLRGHHTNISITCYAPTFHSVLTSLSHGRRGRCCPAPGEGLLVLLPQGKYPTILTTPITPLTMS